MLPELLFPVMQDISRDEFSILNSSRCDSSDLHHGSILKTGNDSGISIKLEDVENWGDTTTTLCNLLRNSDDPLISGGTTISPPKKETKRTISPRESPSPIAPQQTVQSGNQTTPKRKTNRVRRKGAVKLRFHHQALPQEYLEHYEASQNLLKDKELQHNEEQNAISVRNWLNKLSDANEADEPPVNIVNNTNTKTSQGSSSRICNYSDLPYMGEMTLENSKPRRGRKPKKADICHLIYKNYGQIFPGTPSNLNASNLNNNNNVNVNNNNSNKDKHNSNDKVNSGSSKIEIQNKILTSLLEKRLTNTNSSSSNNKNSNNSNKDSKKTGGTSRVEQPLNLCLRDTKTPRSPISPALSTSSSASSVLSSQSSIINQNELEIESTLNFDLSESLDIKNDPILAIDDVEIKRDNDDDDVDKKLLSTKLLKAIKLKSEINSDDNDSMCDETKQPSPSDLTYWKNSNVFLHPMALYYQKMIDMNKGAPNSAQPAPSQQSSVMSTPTAAIGGTSKLVAKNISDLIMKRENLKTNHTAPPTPSTTPNSIKSNESSASSQASNSTVMTGTTNGSSLKSVILSSSLPNTPTQKRKRSAIFIPPMPTDSTSNPTTEVSICKFKFTGGAKPSLQEKKMLSVDSGGNFRYYSGTGDKSMRGYEFFPRESLHQSSLMTNGASPSGIFLNTPGEKIVIPDDPFPSLDLTNDVLQIPTFSPSGPSSTQISSTTLPSASPTTVIHQSQISPHGVKRGQNHHHHHHHLPSTSSSSTTVPSTSTSSSSSALAVAQIPVSAAAASLIDRKKRKSRRSIQREKLEKTFKEKGFLIQTQQLESAEGATYCKFRQLRRFTRYLFRSWKDYLPGDIQQTDQNQL